MAEQLSKCGVGCEGKIIHSQDLGTRRQKREQIEVTSRAVDEAEAEIKASI